MRGRTKKFAVGLLVLALQLVLVNAFAGADEDLLAACKKGDLAKATAAINAGANVNRLDATGNPPIASAIFWPEITTLLLEKGADPNLGKYPALISAANCYSVEVMKLLLAKGADPNKTGELPNPVEGLLAAEKAKGKGANKIMVKAYEDMLKNAGPGLKVTPIRQVVQQTNCSECLDLLIKAGANVQEKDPTDGSNLIHIFASFGNTAEARASLFRQGASVFQDKYGMTTPDWYKNMTAAQNASENEMLKKLVDAGVNINEKNKGIAALKPSTPLETALSGGIGNKKEVMLALINNGADVKAVNQNYGPVILQAVATGFVEVVQAMVEKGADINTEDKMWDDNAKQYVNGFTALTLAAMKDNLPMVKYVIGAGARSSEGVHGFSYSIKTMCATLVMGKTAIYYAIENGNIEMVKFLVESGASWSKKLKIDQLKQTSTQDYGTYKVVTTTCFKDGEYTPSIYARENKNKDMQDYLQSKGI